MRLLLRPTAASTRRPNWRQNAADRIPGLALVAVLAALAITLGRIDWFASTGVSALTVAIVLGMLVGNTLYPRIASAAAGGVTFSKQALLRLGIILYGLRLTFQDIAHVGIAGVAIVLTRHCGISQALAPICRRACLASLVIH